MLTPLSPVLFGFLVGITRGLRTVLRMVKGREKSRMRTPY